MAGRINKLAYEPDPNADSGKIFRRLLLMLKPEWPMIGVGLVLMFLSMPGELFPAFVWMYAVDGLISHAHNTSVDMLHAMFSLGGRIVTWQGLLVSSLVWLMVVYLFAEGFDTASGWVMQRVAQRFIRYLRNKVYDKLQGQSLSYLHRQRTGDLMSRAMSDVDEVQSFIVGSIEVIIGEGVMWLVTVATVMALDWRVSSASLAPLILVFFMLRIFNRRVRPIYRAAREREGDVTNRIQENLSGVTVIKIFNREKEEAARFQETTNAYFDQQIKAINARSTYFPLSRAVGFLSNVNMIGVGAWLILTGRGFTIGKLLMFRGYWWRLFGPVATLARVNDMVQRAAAAGRRVYEVLDAPDELPDTPDARPAGNIIGEMALDHVTFSYGSRDVLHDVSIRIPAGKTVALCGPSGGGKSTILNLLLRFYDPTEGRVTLDGRDLRQIERHSLRREFALVQQESFLFNDSVIDNIRYGHADATMEQVIAATRAANAYGFINEMPAGYDTKVGERGVRLSGGQKQRISIARAFLADPKILLLDEPTSSVEPDSEAAIISALDRLMAGRTTIVTSHRPSLIRQADLVYVIEKGSITASGSPQEVLDIGHGWFSRFLAGEADESEVAEFEPADSLPGDRQPASS